MSREPRVALAPPPDDADGLSAFPGVDIGSDRTFWRCGRDGNGPWWFGSSGSGRFDLSAPDGTCYLAADAIVAVLEVIGVDVRGGVVSADFLDERRLRELHVPSVHRVADATSRSARRFGVTLELSTIVPYDVPQAWARAWNAAGFQGVRYHARHDPRGAELVALFGRSGERTGWRRGRAQVIDGDMRARLLAEAGVRAARPPRRSQLDVRD